MLVYCNSNFFFGLRYKNMCINEYYLKLPSTISKLFHALHYKQQVQKQHLDFEPKRIKFQQFYSFIHLRSLQTRDGLDINKDKYLGS